MAVDVKSSDELSQYSMPAPDSQPDPHVPSVIVTLLRPLASLRLTVVLFLLSIFIVWAGTLAQIEKDIWQVIREYFRMDLSSPWSALTSAFCWIDFRVLTPASLVPRWLIPELPWGWGFWFPSGWLIGLVLLVNLSAAHLIRFRIQATGRRLALGCALLAAGVVLTAVVIAAGSEQTSERLKLFTDWPSLRILWLLTQCTLAGVVLLGGCLLVFGKRGGIVLLHAGIALMMIGELVVGIAAEEGQMTIVEGETVNYVMDSRHLELAIIDSSGTTEDQVTAVPGSRLRENQTLQDPLLPFHLEVLQYHPNSVRRAVRADDTNPATAGIGLREIVEPAPVVSGVDSSGASNRPALYVRFLKPQTGESLGVYLLALEHWFRGQATQITLGENTYDVFLRYKHIYKPYSMHLVDVRHDRYMGTQTPRSYSSELRLVDPTHDVDRMVRIWMNNPLRYGGETFYQSSYGRDANTGIEHTGLQVVTNTGWRIPYVSCMLVVVGMLAQFWITLERYLSRRYARHAAREGAAVGGKAIFTSPTNLPPTRQGASAPALAAGSSTRARWLVPALVVSILGIWLAVRSYPRPEAPGKPDLAAVGRLPVMHEGRIKPFDTLARNSLRMVSDKEDFVDQNGVTQPAIRWLLDVIADTEDVRKHRVFRIQNLDLLETLGLPRRKGFRYSIEEFAPKLEAYEEQVRLARRTPSDQRDLFARKVLELDQRLNTYLLLRESFGAPALRLESLRDDLSREANRRERFANATLPLAVPPRSGEGDWQAYTFAAFDARAQELAAAQGLKVDPPNRAAVALGEVFARYPQRSADAAAFNQAVNRYRQVLVDSPPAEWREGRTEVEWLFNYASPIYYAMILYGLACLLGCCAWLGWSVPLQRTAIGLTLLALVVHSVGLLARMYISGRPPVTSLYSSGLFVAWACVILGLVQERYSRMGVASVVAAFCGFSVLLWALMVLAPQGDSFTVLVAVLDTQFWLATHVLTVTAGYSATLVAGFLGIAFIVRGLVTQSLTSEMGKSIGRMIYGTVCFGIFFSFFGTVLGGLWADDSWGRFWGWDPKENGALLIVLWNALVLHALWGRMIGDRGLAVLAILGNLVTLWSWFVVNELQVGLHTYGFTEGMMFLLYCVGAGHLLFILAGLAPRMLWRSAPA